MVPVAAVHEVTALVATAVITWSAAEVVVTDGDTALPLAPDASPLASTGTVALTPL